MTDVELFGANPAAHHAVSLAIHALNAALVLWLLWIMTGELGLSVLAAALWAIHPLRV